MQLIWPPGPRLVTFHTYPFLDLYLRFQGDTFSRVQYHYFGLISDPSSTTSNTLHFSLRAI